MRSIKFPAVAIVVLAGWIGVASGENGCCDAPDCCGATCCGDSCCGDSCGCSVCTCKPEMTTEEKHCWCVECEEICVPRVRCPWEPGGSPLTCFNWLRKKCETGCGDCCDSCGDCCDSVGAGCCCDSSCCTKPCGKVKCVRDLKKKTYEVDVCEWKYEIRRLPPCCCCDCGADPCACGACVGE